MPITSLATCRQLVANAVEDNQQTKFDSNTYNQSIALAQEQFCADARAIVKEVTLNLPANTTEISLPSDFLVCVLVRHQGLKLAPVTKWELSFQSGQDWTTIPAGIPTMYFIDQQTDSLGVVPQADSGHSGNVITLDYAAIPVAPATDATNLLLGDQILSYYIPAITAWAARYLLLNVPQDNNTIAKRQALFVDYQRYVNQCISIYGNLADEPIQMRGGRDWQDQTLANQPNAFTD